MDKKNMRSMRGWASSYMSTLTVANVYYYAPVGYLRRMCLCRILSERPIIKLDSRLLIVSASNMVASTGT